jgi:predicted phosphate transport protein (TIGR00153 family)
MISNPLAKLVKRSPLISIQEHMRAVVDCAREVPGLFQALCDSDTETFREIAIRIAAREDEADKIKNRLRGQLPRSLFMPIDRRDLLEVLHIQDSIADTAQDIAELLYEREMQIPIEMQAPIIALADSCLKVCEYALLVIDELDELLEMGFRGNQAKKVREMIDQLNLIEDDADELELELARALYRIESKIDPVSVIMWYRIIEWVGDLADHAEKVGDRIRLFIAR